MSIHFKLFQSVKYRILKIKILETKNEYKNYIISKYYRGISRNDPIICYLYVCNLEILIELQN